MKIFYSDPSDFLVIDQSWVRDRVFSVHISIPQIESTKIVKDWRMWISGMFFLTVSVLATFLSIRYGNPRFNLDTLIFLLWLVFFYFGTWVSLSIYRRGRLVLIHLVSGKKHCLHVVDRKIAKEIQDAIASALASQKE